MNFKRALNCLLVAAACLTLDEARASFLAQRGACMACHVAEQMPFLNDTPIFRDTASFPSD